MPAEVFHPADYVEDELATRGWTLDRLAVEMGGDWERNRCALDFLMVRQPGIRLGDVADQLGRAFGTSGDFWRNLESAWLNQTGVN